MLPRLPSLLLIFIFSAFFAKAQKQENFIPFNQQLYTFSQQSLTSLSSSYLHTSTFKVNDTVPGTCLCSASPQIVAAGKQGNVWSYQGIANASCVDGSITYRSQNKEHA